MGFLDRVLSVTLKAMTTVNNRIDNVEMNGLNALKRPRQETQQQTKPVWQSMQPAYTRQPEQSQAENRGRTADGDVAQTNEQKQGQTVAVTSSSVPVNYLEHIEIVELDEDEEVLFNRLRDAYSYTLDVINLEDEYDYKKYYGYCRPEDYNRSHEKTKGRYKKFLHDEFKKILEFSKGDTVNGDLYTALSDDIQDLVFKYYLIANDDYQRGNYYLLISYLKNAAFRKCCNIAGIEQKDLINWKYGRAENSINISKDLAYFVNDFIEKISMITSIAIGEFNFPERSDTIMPLVTGYNNSGFMQFMHDCADLFIRKGFNVEGEGFAESLNNNMEIDKELCDLVDEVLELDSKHGKFLYSPNGTTYYNFGIGSFASTFERALSDYLVRSQSEVYSFGYTYMNFMKAYYKCMDIKKAFAFISKMNKMRDELTKFLSKVPKGEFNEESFRVMLRDTFSSKRITSRRLMDELKRNIEFRKTMVGSFFANPEGVFLILEDFVKYSETGEERMANMVDLFGGVSTCVDEYLYVLAIYSVLLSDFGFDLLSVDFTRFMYGNDEAKINEFEKVVKDKELFKQALDINFGKCFEFIGLPVSMKEFVSILTFNVMKYNTVATVEEFKHEYTSNWNRVDNFGAIGTQYNKELILKRFKTLSSWLFGDMYSKQNLKAYKRRGKGIIKTLRKSCKNKDRRLLLTCDFPSRQVLNNAILCNYNDGVLGIATSYEKELNDEILRESYEILHNEIDNPFVYTYIMKLYFGMDSDRCSTLNLTRMAVCANSAVQIKWQPLVESNWKYSDLSIDYQRDGTSDDVIKSLQDVIIDFVKRNKLVEKHGSGCILSSYFGVNDIMSNHFEPLYVTNYFDMIEYNTFNSITGMLINSCPENSYDNIRSALLSNKGKSYVTRVSYQFRTSNKCYGMESMTYSTQMTTWYRFFDAVALLFDLEFNMLKYLESVKENDITLNLRRTIASSVGFIDFFPIFNTSEFNEHNSELTFCRYLDRLRKFRVELDYRYLKQSLDPNDKFLI